MTGAYDAPCGQRAVLTQGNAVEYDAGLAGRRDPGGYVSGSCVKPKREAHSEHQDAAGNTWIESVR
jgi:hypothetical protein